MLVVSSGTRPIVCADDPLTPEQIDSILLLDLLAEPTPGCSGSRPLTAPTTEDDVC
jgi:hypothetical protein